MTIIEKIIAHHSKYGQVKPGDIVDVFIDARAARDFGGANVVKNISDNGLAIKDPERTLFTFDCNPTGSDQKYAANQHLCRQFARDWDIKVYDINSGIGTHLLIDEGYVYPGATAVSTDSHANILGAVGAFGQGMGDIDIASAWDSGKIWFKVPQSVKLVLNGEVPGSVSAKDIVLNLLAEFGANKLLGNAIELYGPAVDKLGLDDRITISSMATEMGAIIIIFPPNKEVIDYCIKVAREEFKPVFADEDATYLKTYSIDASKFSPMVSLPGKPHDTLKIEQLEPVPIDSAFIGSCTNGRIEDMRKAAGVLKGKKIPPGVVLKIVPSTDTVWKQCLEEGIIEIFKNAGALVSNAGCAGCAAGQVGQNGPGEVTVSTGNRNFPGKQGKGSVYLASPSVVASSALAGYILQPGSKKSIKMERGKKKHAGSAQRKSRVITDKPVIVEGRCWVIDRDNIDTDMIFHNRYLTITDKEEMGQYAFDNLDGYEDFAKKALPGDIIITGKNFGSGSSRQQAVDCFYSLGVQAIVASSFGAIYERNAINAAFPVLNCNTLDKFDIKNGDIIKINFETGEIINNRNNSKVRAIPFFEVQMDIYKKDGVL